MLTEPVQTFLISDSALSWFWTFLNLNLFHSTTSSFYNFLILQLPHSTPSSFYTFLILNLPDSDLSDSDLSDTDLSNLTFLITNLFDSAPFWSRTFLILLSQILNTYQTPSSRQYRGLYEWAYPSVSFQRPPPTSKPEMTVNLFYRALWQFGDETGPLQSPLSLCPFLTITNPTWIPSHDDHPIH